jgi:abortive infection bacteriophage resistance protein
MKFEKKSTTPQEQAQKLLARGLVAEEAVLIQRLTSVSYYRLTGYLYPFLQIGENSQKRYTEGTTLEVIWSRYCFDRRLRVLMLDAIERVEVSVRASWFIIFVISTAPSGI